MFYYVKNFKELWHRRLNMAYYIIMLWHELDYMAKFVEIYGKKTQDFIMA